MPSAGKPPPAPSPAASRAPYPSSQPPVSRCVVPTAASLENPAACSAVIPSLKVEDAAMCPATETGPCMGPVPASATATIAPHVDTAQPSADVEHTATAKAERSEPSDVTGALLEPCAAAPGGAAARPEEAQPHCEAPAHERYYQAVHSATYAPACSHVNATPTQGAPGAQLLRVVLYLSVAQTHRPSMACASSCC